MLQELLMAYLPSPWRRKWHPTPVLLPGKFHGQRSLVVYSPWGRKELDTTEWFHFLSFPSPLGLKNTGLTLFLTITCMCMCCGSQSCLTLHDPMDCSPPGSSVHGILQARILEWVAMPSFRGSSSPRDVTHISYISCIGSQVLYH